MIKDITSTSYIDTIFFDKKENRLVKKLTRCKTRKCSKINKERMKENKIYENGLEKQCTDKDIKLWSECLKDYDNKYGSKNKILYNKFVKCGNEKCSKEYKTLKKYKKLKTKY
jgi:hypothetical protein